MSRRASTFLVQQMTDIFTVIEATSTVADVPVRYLVGPSQAPAVVYGRWLSMYGCRLWLDVSLPTLGKVFHKDHTTILHGVKRIEEDQSKQTQESLTAIEKLLIDWGVLSEAEKEEPPEPTNTYAAWLMEAGHYTSREDRLLLWLSDRMPIEDVARLYRVPAPELGQRCLALKRKGVSNREIKSRTEERSGKTRTKARPANAQDDHQQHRARLDHLPAEAEG